MAPPSRYEEERSPQFLAGLDVRPAARQETVGAGGSATFEHRLPADAVAEVDHLIDYDRETGIGLVRNVGSATVGVTAPSASSAMPSRHRSNQVDACPAPSSRWVPARITMCFGSGYAALTVTVWPGIPTLTAPAGNTTGSYTVNWTNSARATSYVLQEEVGSGAWAGAQDSSSASTSHTRQRDWNLL